MFVQEAPPSFGNPKAQEVMRGWECPKCKRVYSPHVRECEHCSQNLPQSH